MCCAALPLGLAKRIGNDHPMLSKFVTRASRHTSVSTDSFAVGALGTVPAALLAEVGYGKAGVQANRLVVTNEH